MSGTTTASYPASASAKLLYHVPPAGGVRAYTHINPDPVTGKRKQNYTSEEKEVPVIENLRGKEDSVSLDTAGFQFFHHPAKHTSFTNDEDIIGEYYPESIELIKKLTGASRVELFDHTIRRRRPGETDSPDRRQPVAQVHVDQTSKSAVDRVHRHLPASDAPKLLERRFQILNLWRPINHPAIDWPLTLCDARSVSPNDVFAATIIFPDREGEVLGVQYNENHKWKYLHGMTPDEVVLFKCFDSVQDGSVAVFTPHTGFYDASAPEGTPLRESIELRALVFYD